jgi:uncharacterized protein YoxC
VSGGAIAALIAAGAFARLVLVLCIPIYRLRYTVDAATRAINDLNAQAKPILGNVNTSVEGVNTAIGQVHTTLDGVNMQLMRVDTITGHAAQVTANVANLATVVSSAASNPLVKATAFTYGVRRAARLRKGADDEARVRAALKEQDANEKATRRAARRAARGRCARPSSARPARPPDARAARSGATSPQKDAHTMRRLLWLGVGVAVGVLAVRAISRTAQRFTPGGLADGARHSIGGLAGGVRTFLDDVREGMAEREAEIHAAFAEGEMMHGDPDGLGEL